VKNLWNPNISQSQVNVNNPFQSNTIIIIIIIMIIIIIIIIITFISVSNYLALHEILDLRTLCTGANMK